MTDPSGQPVTFEDYESFGTYGSSGYVGFAISTFDVSEPGNYELKVGGQPLGGTVAVGRSPFEKITNGVLLGLVFGFGGFLLALGDPHRVDGRPGPLQAAHPGRQPLRPAVRGAGVVGGSAPATSSTPSTRRAGTPEPSTASAAATRRPRLPAAASVRLRLLPPPHRPRPRRATTPRRGGASRRGDGRPGPARSAPPAGVRPAPVRPSGWWYVATIGIAGVGIVVAVVLFANGVRSARTVASEITSVEPGEQGLVTFESAGSFTLYYAGPTKVTVTDDMRTLERDVAADLRPEGGGAPVRDGALRERAGHHADGRGPGGGAQHVLDPGSGHLRAADRPDRRGSRPPKSRIIVGKSLYAPLARGAILALVAIGISAVLSIVASIALALTRGRAKRAAREQGWGGAVGPGPRARVVRRPARVDRAATHHPAPATRLRDRAGSERSVDSSPWPTSRSASSELWERRDDARRHRRDRARDRPRGHRPARRGRGPGRRARRRRRRRPPVAEAGDPAAVPQSRRWRRSSSGPFEYADKIPLKTRLRAAGRAGGARRVGPLGRATSTRA